MTSRLKFSPTKPTAAQETSPNFNTERGGMTDPFLSQRADHNRTMVTQHQQVPLINRSITARAGNRRHYNTAVTDQHELNESLLRSSADIEASESSTITHEYDFSPNNYSVSSPIPIIEVVGPERQVRNSKGRSTKWKRLSNSFRSTLNRRKTRQSENKSSIEIVRKHSLFIR